MFNGFRKYILRNIFLKMNHRKMLAIKLLENFDANFVEYKDKRCRILRRLDYVNKESCFNNIGRLSKTLVFSK